MRAGADAEWEINSYGLEATGHLPISGTPWGTYGYAGWDRIASDVPHSPAIEAQDQYSGRLGVTYTFDTSLPF